MDNQSVTLSRSFWHDKEKSDNNLYQNRHIAYFSMEIGISDEIPTYSGGLGILAGDMIRSFADLGVPAIAITLLYRKGYFQQHIDSSGWQSEEPVQWDPLKNLKMLPNRVSVSIEGRSVVIQAWIYVVNGVANQTVPVVYLDTDCQENAEQDRHLTDFLYGGDERYRLSQEIILGIGGMRMLRDLNCSQITRYHMNEGHSSLLTLELLIERKWRNDAFWDIEGVKRLCVFTTHTPVPAGHDKFSHSLVKEILGDYVPYDLLKRIGGEEHLNMTLLALNLSHYINGVAKEHGKVSQEMFPGYHINFITNGVHSVNWTSPEFAQLYDNFVSGWRSDPFSLRYALSIPKSQIWSAHQNAKSRLFDRIKTRNGIILDTSVLTIGFARRATAYKRADLIFKDIPRLQKIARVKGPLQFVFGGKAHPKDQPGKEIIRSIIETASSLQNEIKIVYLENYDMSLARLMIAGTDIWLNTPCKPQEASGTSGMKAAHNGVLSFSILDGWWVEGCIEGLTGWAIGSIKESENDDVENAASLYEKLEHEIIPRYYGECEKWIDMMRHAIAINGSFFNTHRMVQQYVLNAYLE